MNKPWFNITAMNIDDDCACWELNIALRGKDIDALLWGLNMYTDRLNAARKSPHKFRKQESSGVSGSEDNLHCRYDLQIRCSDEVEIIELRKRADELEAGLKK